MADIDYPDWQPPGIVLPPSGAGDGAVLWQPTPEELGNESVSPVLETAETTGIHFTCVGQKAFNFQVWAEFKWYSDSGLTHLVGERRVMLSWYGQGNEGSLLTEFELRSRGPYLQITIRPLKELKPPDGAEITVIASNRANIDRYPQRGYPIVRRHTEITTERAFPTYPYAGPAVLAYENEGPAFQLTFECALIGSFDQEEEGTSFAVTVPEGSGVIPINLYAPLGALEPNADADKCSLAVYAISENGAA